MRISTFLCRVYSLALAFSLLAPSVAAQSESPSARKNQITLGGGAGIPGGELRQSMSSSALVRVAYGFRIRRHFQADIALDVVMRSAGISISQQSLVGEIRIRDDEYLLPFGGRAILPLVSYRLELFAGGGVVYLRYEETAEIPGLDVYGDGYVNIPCPTCRSRAGWGYYGTAGLDFALDRGQRVWLGVEGRYIKGRTSGALLGSGAPFGTNDTWFNPSMNLKFRF